MTQCLALHDVGPQAKGVAFSEEISIIGAAVVVGIVQADVLHRVLYPQVHVNGIKKKKKKALLVQRVPAKSKRQWFNGREERSLGLESRCKRIQD